MDKKKPLINHTNVYIFQHDFVNVLRNVVITCLILPNHSKNKRMLRFHSFRGSSLGIPSNGHMLKFEDIKTRTPSQLRNT